MAYNVTEEKYTNMSKEELIRQCMIKDEYCFMIRDIGLDYDGYHEAENLILLIDEFMDYCANAIDGNDKQKIYEDSEGKSLNILGESI